VTLGIRLPERIDRHYGSDNHTSEYGARGLYGDECRQLADIATTQLGRSYLPFDS
jgi:hypothetical protein